ncbi:uncharacterized protein EI90DRAFT_2603191 [Cantharellus anzutake]|uniref:uncharacterized protein n=1 Tax=Cantharellus anzutake TaxID=1750568 RepID=UPI0019048E29|nr:uncharacterized protein EI90DRAFT_557168 [Cantharellus anzutake]XP_038910374.1 uncharacterized protein EI90DRAFT_2603191 [Cantharellus anzutake]KAF8313371.1 hypothetical protein EI90DRAFT_557168 [Cantharellus anzutake]KAF8320573.1 hypothetical protein EI90DRAFT_2603191 [Cantharellus anzutake]
MQPSNSYTSTKIEIALFTLAGLDHAIMTALIVFKILTLKRQLPPSPCHAEQLRFYNNAVTVLSLYSIIYLPLLSLYPVFGSIHLQSRYIYMPTLCQLNAILPTLFTLHSLFHTYSGH